LNNLNRKQYASAGAGFGITLSYINGMEREMPGSTSQNRDTVSIHREWFDLNLTWDNYFQTIGPVKLGFYLEGNVSTHPLFSNYTATLLYMPAFQPLPEMQARFIPSYRSGNYGAIGLKGIIRIYKKVEFRLEGYVFQPYQEVIHDPLTQQVSFGPIFSNRSILGSAVVVYNSFLGPLSLAVNYYDKQTDSYTINLNFGYILFNKRALP
jgi:NTE family protein